MTAHSIPKFLVLEKNNCKFWIEELRNVAGIQVQGARNQVDVELEVLSHGMTSPGPRRNEGVCNCIGV
jgi:hypothetical protein